MKIVRETNIPKERREEIERRIKVLLIDAMSNTEILSSLRFKNEMVIAEELTYAYAMKDHWVEMTQIQMGVFSRERM